MVAGYAGLRPYLSSWHSRHALRRQPETDARGVSNIIRESVKESILQVLAAELNRAAQSASLAGSCMPKKSDEEELQASPGFDFTLINPVIRFV